MTGIPVSGIAERLAAGKDKLYVVLSREGKFLGWRWSETLGRNYLDIVAEGGVSCYNEPVGFYLEVGSDAAYEVGSGRLVSAFTLLPEDDK